jgi:excinuclease ABC subunit C
METPQPCKIDSKATANWTDSFVDFGPDPLLSDPSLQSCAAGLARIDATDLKSFASIQKELKGLVQQFVPYTPGVYGILDPLLRLVYVGKSKALRARLLSYFLPGARDEKAGHILKQARAIVWETQPSEFAALLREQALIRTWQPSLNVVGMPNRSQPAYLSLGRSPAESFYVTRQWDTRASICRGPFYGSTKLYRAAEILNRYFLLRDCSSKTPMLFSNQLPLFDLPERAGCLRAELGTCLAPCLTDSLRTDYQSQEDLARAWMRGESSNIHLQMLEQMDLAIQRTQFERAARLHEDSAILKWLYGKLKQLQKASSNPPSVYWVQTAGGTKFPKEGILYLMRSGGVQYAIAQRTVTKTTSTKTTSTKTTSTKTTSTKISKLLDAKKEALETWLRADQQVEFKYSLPHESLGLVATWFQKNPSLRKNYVEVTSIDEALEKSSRLRPSS